MGNVLKSHGGEFPWFASHHSTKGVVHVQEAMIPSHQREAERTFLEDPSEPLFALALRILHPLPLCDVEEHPPARDVLGLFIFNSGRT